MSDAAGLALAAPPRASGPRALARERTSRKAALFSVILGPLVAAALVERLSEPGMATADARVATFVAFAAGALAVRRTARFTPLLPLMRRLWAIGGPVLGLALLAVLKLLAVLPGARPLVLLAAAVAAGAVGLVPRLLPGAAARRGPPLRTAVIGSAATATMFADELEAAGVQEYAVVGRIPAGRREAVEGSGRDVPVLGNLEQLGRAVAEHDLDLLVMGQEAPRLEVFHQLAQGSADRAVRLWQLSGLYEDVLGHVPITDINAAWFQYVLHPKYRQTEPGSKRAIDLLLAGAVGLAVLPLLALLALLVRTDGGPAIFRQQRIGQAGRPFTLYKLRTMTVGAGDAAQWAQIDDPRITRVGRILRRTHLDELPQVMNVLRGDMSLVGPRPEQPAFVEQLEGMLAFYQRRHLIKPGVTGWAQVRCGYAGSDVGSAWKLCHDLFYLRHRSTALDLMILGETLRTIVHDTPPAVVPTSGRLTAAALGLADVTPPLATVEHAA